MRWKKAVFPNVFLFFFLKIILKKKSRAGGMTINRKYRLMVIKHHLLNDWGNICYSRHGTFSGDQHPCTTFCFQKAQRCKSVHLHLLKGKQESADVCYLLGKLLFFQGHQTLQIYRGTPAFQVFWTLFRRLRCAF